MGFIFNILQKKTLPSEKGGNTRKIKKYIFLTSTVKLGDKERFDKEQIGVKESFLVTKCQFTS